MLKKQGQQTKIISAGSILELWSTPPKLYQSLNQKSHTLTAGNGKKMAKTRRRFSAEFKSKVALEALKENKTMAELTQEYGVQSVQIKEWKQHLLESLPKVFESGAKAETNAREAEEKEGKLFQKIGQLNVEIDWLKKKMGIR